MIDLLNNPTISVSADRENFVLQFPQTWAEEVKKKLPGIRKDRERGNWLLPLNSANADILRTAASFEWTDAAKGAAAQTYILEDFRVMQSSAASAELFIPRFGLEPYPYQKAGIIYAAERKRVVIGDEMGLGKTIQGIGTIELTESYPAVVITPASLKLNWGDDQGEIKRCVPHRKVVVADKNTSPLVLRMADIVVTNYEQLVGNRSYRNSEGKMTRTSFTDTSKKDVIPSALLENLLKINFRAGIWDEAHKLKDGATANTMASMELRKSIPMRLLLTGTPMLNEPAEFATLLKFLDRLDEFGGWWNFMTVWCGLQKTKNIGWQPTKGGGDLVELNRRMRSTCYIRRLKKEVLTELPDKTRGHVLVEIDNAAEYRQAEKDLINWVAGRVLVNEQFLATIEHLRDASDGTYERAIYCEQARRQEAAEKNEALVRITALKNVIARGKLKGGKAWIDTFLESGEPLIVFATSKELLNQLIKWYPKAARIISDDSPEERQANVRRFQTDLLCNIIICAFGTSAGSSPGGVGHTLTRASNVCFFELGWNNAHHDQAEDRAHRIGQKNNVTAWYLLGKIDGRDTFDVDIAETIEEKRELCKAVVDGISVNTDSSILDTLVHKLAARGGA